MKKILLGTTALVAMGVISEQAFAADKIALGMGGFMRDYIGYANDEDAGNTTHNVGMWTNTEVNFKGNTTLDNGINVAVRMDLEMDGATTRTVDVSYLTLSSDSMGALSMGVQFHGLDDFNVGAPMVGPVGWGNEGDWAAGLSSTTNGIANTGDATIKLKYVTPSMNGLTGYVSYTPGEGFGRASNGRAVAYNVASDGSTVGVAYEGEFSGAAVSANLGHMNDTNANLEYTVFGLNVGMNGFTVGGSYEAQSDQAAGSSALDGNAWDLGVSYATGPYEISAAYMQAQNDGAVGGGSNEDTHWNLGATYDLGAGVALAGNYYYAKGNPEGAGVNTSVSGVVAGIEVSF
jgi:outer membrane protein OmpU